MIKSMTGFGSATGKDSRLEKINLELRSINHRFLEILFNLPQGLSYLETRLREQVKRKIKRGRIIASVNIGSRPYLRTMINPDTVKNYLGELNKLRRQFSLKDEVSLGILMRLPGVVSLEEAGKLDTKIQQRMKELLQSALIRLELSRKRAGRAIYRDLIARNNKIKIRLKKIEKRTKLAVGQKAAGLDNNEEKSSFLKSADIAEELTLLGHHLKNFRGKLNKSVPVGKELDFIAQEMQREINTLAAKSFDPRVISDAIEIKTQIEKMREQLQNVE